MIRNLTTLFKANRCWHYRPLLEKLGKAQCSGVMISFMLWFFLSPNLSFATCDGHINKIKFKALSGGSNVTISNGATYSEDDLPDSYRIEAHVSGTHESLRWEISGALSDVHTENYLPYTYPGGDGPIDLAPGTYTIKAKLYKNGNGSGTLCHTKVVTFTIGGSCEVNHPGTFSPGAVSGCSPFDAPRIEIAAATCQDGSQPSYQWQVKHNSNSGSWQDIQGATGRRYDPPAITQTKWYRRLAICPCDTDPTTNAFDVHVTESPVATPSTADATCGEQNGSITFTFPDNPNRTGIEFSIDGGDSYPHGAADNSGSKVVSGLAEGVYHLFVRWGNNDCPVDLGNVTIEAGGDVDHPGTFSPGSVSGCSPFDAPRIEIAAATCTDGSSPSYQWQVKHNSNTGSWEDINGATNRRYNPPAISQTKWYRRLAICPCEEKATTNAFDVHVKESPIATANTADASCEEADGSITFTFPDNPNRTGIEFSIDGGNSYPYGAADNSGSLTVHNLAEGTYHLFVRWGNDECPVDLGNETIEAGGGEVANPGTFNPGSVSGCIPFDAPRIEIAAATCTDGSNPSYQWQVKHNSNTGSWEDINGATNRRYNPPAISQTKWYRRLAICPCEEKATTNAFDVHVKEAPIATVSTEDATCEGGDGSITFTFPDNPNRTGIEFSIDGGNSYPYHAADNSGSRVVNALTAGTYHLFVRWGNNECPVDLGNETIGEPTEEECNPCPTTFFNGGLIEAGECTDGDFMINSINAPDFNGEPLEIVWIKSTNADNCAASLGELGPYNVGAVYDAFLAAGGFGNADPQIGTSSWMFVTDNDGDDLKLTVTGLAASTCYMRCARPVGCERFWGEAGPVRVDIDDCVCIGDVENPGTFSPGHVVGCEVPFDAPVIEIAAGTCADGSAPSYRWEVKHDSNNGSWEVIPNATNRRYNPPAASSSKWFRRFTICPCEEKKTTNVFDVHVKAPPVVTVSTEDIDCDNAISSLTFHFEDRAGRSHIEFSIDGGASWPADYTVPDNSGSLTLELAPGSYHLFTRWGNNECPVDLGNKTINDGPRGEVEDPGTFNPGHVTGCGAPFDAPEIQIGPATCTENAMPAYKWQVKEDAQNGTWTDIPGANNMTFDPPALDATVWYRRVAICPCEEAPTTNAFDVHVKTLPQVTVSTTDADCDGNGGSVTFSFVNDPGRSHIEFSLDGGATWPAEYTVADNSGSLTIDLTAGTYHLFTRWGNNQCPVDLGNETINALEGDVADPGTFNPGSVTGCGAPFDAPEIQIGPATCTDGAMPAYKWQIKEDAQNGTWTDIPGANNMTFDPPALDATVWYRRVAICACEEKPTTNAFDVHIKAPPVVAVTTMDGDCDGNNGSVTFTFDDRADRTNIEFSIDGGATWPGAYNVSDASGSFTIDLAAGTYHLFTRWGNNQCPVDLGNETISAPGPDDCIDCPTTIFNGGLIELGDCVAGNTMISSINAPDYNGAALEVVWIKTTNAADCASSIFELGPFNVGSLYDAFLAAGGFGVADPQIGTSSWMFVTDNDGDDLKLTIEGVTGNACYMRCARVEGCERFFGEAGPVLVSEDDCVNCEDYFDGGVTSASSCNNGTVTISSDSAPNAGGLPYETIWVKSTNGNCEAALYELGPINVGTIYNNFVAAGGFGVADAAIPGTSWTFVTDGDADDLSLTVTGLNEAACFMRCARIIGCDRFLGEGNLVSVDCASGPSTDPVTYEVCNNDLSVNGTSNGVYYFLKVYTSDYSTVAFECNSFSGGCAEPTMINLPDGDYVLDVILLDDAWQMDFRVTANISLPQACATPLVSNDADQTTVEESRTTVLTTPETPEPVDNGRVLIETIPSTTGLSVFPNPAIDEVFFYSAELAGKTVQLQILNNTGQEVTQQRVNNFSEGPFNLDVSKYPNGIYYARFAVEGQEDIVKKFIVQRGK